MSENEATLIDEPESQQALAVANQQHYMARRDEMTVDDVLKRLAQVKDLMVRAMKKDVDYGVIPGTEKKGADGKAKPTKPTLLKPGAELLGALFRLRPEYEITWTPVPDKPGHLAVFIKCKLFKIQTGEVAGEGVGQCSTMESKYRWRQASRSCPKCGKEAIIKGKAEYGGGWLCFKKKGGCGAKFEDDDKSITGQQVGRVENEDISDLHNTVVKMAAKRAKIDATITATAASSLFTQDLEPDENPDPPDPFSDEPYTPHVNQRSDKPEGLTKPQMATIQATTRALAAKTNRDPKEYLQGIYNELELVGVHSTKDLTKEEASRVIDKLNEIKGDES